MKNSSQNKVLITCFHFPPNHGIGGRRWGKLAKDLARKGVEVHVIKAEPKEGKAVSHWSDDVKDPNIVVYSLPRTYPKVLSNPENNLKGRLKYKYYRSLFLRKYDGTIYDDSLGWEDIYPEKAKEIIKKEGIKNVIVTGAPFNLLYYTALLKKDFNDLNIIVDYRDPWINAANYGMKDLDEKRRLHERQKQEYVLRNVNYVVYPSDSFKDEILSTVIDAKKIKAEFRLLTHFYDTDDFPKSIPVSTKKKKIKFIYGGAIYLAIDNYINQLAEILDRLKEESPDLYALVEIDFYTDQFDKLKSLDRHKRICTIQKPIGKAIHNEVLATDFVLIFLTEHNKNYRTTKFMETLPFKKPFVYLGPNGDAQKFISEKNLGYVVGKYEDFKQLISDANNSEVNYNSDFNHKDFSLSKIGDEVLSMMKF